MKTKKNKNLKNKKMAKKPKRVLITKKKSVKIKSKIKKKKKVLKRPKLKIKKAIIKSKKNKKLKARKRIIKKKIKTQVKLAKRKKRVISFKRNKPSAKPKKAKKAVAQDKVPSLAGSFFKAKIKVIGIGGGGGSIVSEIGRSLGKATFVVADTDMRSFKKKPGIKYFLFGQNLTHGLGTGVDPALGRLAAESEKEKISRFFDDQDIVIFIASLGGGVGSGSTQVFAEAAKDFNGITFGIFTLPFKFEGKNKYNIALKSLHELRKSLNVSITIPNEKIFKVIEANTAITDAFSMVNKNLIESLESLIELIYNPGIINIDFADVRAILSGRGNLAFLNTQESSGKQRAEDITKMILHNPLYQNNNFAADKILFNIAGGDNLSMFEVDKISRTISEQNPKAKIIFGISKNSKYKNKIKTTLLMTGPGSKIKEKEIVVKPEIISEVLAPASPKKIVKKKISAKNKKTHKIIKKKKEKKKVNKKIPFGGELVPVFNETPFEHQVVKSAYGDITESKQFNRVNIVESSQKPKKAIRRTAMDIKKAEELKEKEQSLQEKEWEIPAFLRLKK